MKAWMLLLPLPVLAAVAMVPQDPAQAPKDDMATVVPISEVQYVSLQGTATTLSARNVVEIRFIDDVTENLRLELVYENGDYSLIAAQAIHLSRTGTGSREVKLVRCKTPRMRFPRLP